MALFDRFFSGHKITQQNEREERNVSRKISPSFGSEQVRLVLFRECDFRGRKLLFDSETTQKVPMEKTEPDKKFVEVSNGYGYLVATKPNGDYQELSEMVFGSVAMSFRGTYFKIHSLTSPPRLMFTQVFSSPQRRRPKTASISSNQSRLSARSGSSSTTFDHSIKLTDDSVSDGTCSTSDRLSDRSTASDTVLVCRRPYDSPLDFTAMKGSQSKNSLVVDSGCGDQSFSSFSTGPLNFPTWETVFSSKDLSSLPFSSSGILRRFLRSSTRSLQRSSVSLPSSSCVALQRNHHPNGNGRANKLGLSIIVDIPAESETFLTQLFMEHVALIEALIWRTRAAIETAYQRPSCFVSLMVEVARQAALWLVNLLGTARAVTNLWNCLSAGCDNRDDTVMNAFLNDLDARSSSLRRRSWLLTSSSFSSNNSDGSDLNSESSFLSSFSVRTKKELFGFNLGRFLKTDVGAAGQQDFVAEKFLKEFCELLEELDAKHTNFFMSTLLTSVLTHHLGWVATVFPLLDGDEQCARLDSKQQQQQPYNALWGQLTDLYGAIGHPIKTAQTVITGTNRNNVIPKLLSSLTYFIRFGNVERREVRRSAVEGENRTASIICVKNNCIPQSNYKKYEDHVKELLPAAAAANETGVKPSSSKCLTKVKSCVGLRTLIDEEQPKSALGKGLLNGHATLPHFEENWTTADQPCASATQEDVVFVLGDDEQLVGLKKEPPIAEMDDESKTGAGGVVVAISGAKRKISVTKRPSALARNATIDDVTLKHSATSYESLCLIDDSAAPRSVALRAQSEPPEMRGVQERKYQYTRVKFNLQQYPQVVRNYMKSKNIELEGLSLGEKLFDKFATVQHNIKLDLSGYETDSEEVEALQTPSNASELEFSPDMGHDVANEDFGNGSGGSSTVDLTNGAAHDLKLINIPMPKSLIKSDVETSALPYTATIIKGLVDTYIPDMVLQGTVDPNDRWDSEVKNNLAMNTQHALLDQPVAEAVAIVANTDTWDVQVISSHTYVIDKGTNGVRAGMSQLVADMLDSLLQMWKLHLPPHYCLRHIEQRLQELCVRSKALAQLLLTSEFCNMELLTSTLRIEINDVPLLMAVASTHTPEVTHKYGLSFQ